ncbi:oligosaccharide flippase family protein [Akkermansiaceae bacterium]|nr:oligosaccharide flippase family protein [Akkermansiaceae bacterium]MDA7518635.1 oligosaccharide flippase family protein [Akkermansiaceae bacterium]MDA7674802.1 oligosaccharide flippase family protein [Akkermansiaceae bacterium]MDB4041087.1 oligosaccharide flippase family protein [Akkermansiaceae bacterium]MDB4412237.1 oligosaccharide flippase family protein [Akkermansiaceae bacterium]
MSDLHSKNSLWSALEQFGGKILALLGAAVMARILEKEDFGLFATVAIVFTLNQQIIDGGLSQKVLQRRGDYRDDLNAFFWSNNALSIFMVIVLLLLSNQISEFFGEPRLNSLLAALCLVTLVSNFFQAGSIDLIKQGKHSLIAKIRLITGLSGTISGISMAFLGFGVWSLIGQQLVGATFAAVALFYFSSYRPSSDVKKDSIVGLVKFGSPLCLAQVYRSFASQVSMIFIGKIYDLVTLAQVERGKVVPSQITNALSAATTRVNFPTLSEVQHDPKLRTENFLRMSTSSLLVGFLFTIPLVGYPEQFIILILGNQWAGAASIFALAAYFIPAQAFWIILIDLLKSVGLVRSVMKWSLGTSTVQIIAVCLLAQYGPWAAILGDLIGRIVGCLFLVGVSISQEIITPKVYIKSISGTIKILGGPLLLLGVMKILALPSILAIWPITVLCGILILQSQGYLIIIKKYFHRLITK